MPSCPFCFAVSCSSRYPSPTSTVPQKSEESTIGYDADFRCSTTAGLPTGVSGQAARSCRLGGRAMPAAWKTLPTWPATAVWAVMALPSFSQLAQHFGNAEPFPEPPEQQWPANAGAGDAARLVLAAERADDALTDTAALALTLDEVEIGMASGRLLANVHPVCCPRVQQRNHSSLSPLKMFHYTIEQNAPNRPFLPRQINHLLDPHSR